MTATWRALADETADELMPQVRTYLDADPPPDSAARDHFLRLILAQAFVSGAQHGNLRASEVIVKAAG